MGGQAKPIAADLGGVVFADGSAAPQTLARLPLSEGYSTTFRNFDVQKQSFSRSAVHVPPAGAGGRACLRWSDQLD
jgi:hypothetical protein